MACGIRVHKLSAYQSIIIQVITVDIELIDICSVITECDSLLKSAFGRIVPIDRLFEIYDKIIFTTYIHAGIIPRHCPIFNTGNSVEETIKQRLVKNLSELTTEGQYDENRFEAELIYYLEKLDITEEKVRLRQHCNYFRESSDEDQAGKKLGFISQEMGREINTLGSKANEVNIQRLVVMMKDELEKIKEQVLNIL